MVKATGSMRKEGNDKWAVHYFASDIETHLQHFVSMHGGLSCINNVRVLLLLSQERLATLKKQSSQIALQAQQDRENFQREKNNLLIMLQKVATVAACWGCKFCIVFTLPWCLQEREKLASLDGKYAELSEGQSFANNRVAITEVGPSRKNSHTQSCFQWPGWNRF